jgi:hypothetical protein
MLAEHERMISDNSIMSSLDNLFIVVIEGGRSDFVAEFNRKASAEKTRAAIVCKSQGFSIFNLRDDYQLY